LQFLRARIALPGNNGARIWRKPDPVIRESSAVVVRMKNMAQADDNISIKIEIDEDAKTAIILIPWEQLVKLDGAHVLKWIERAAKVRAEWEAKGYRCK
jgi:hypothetical protein